MVPFVFGSTFKVTSEMCHKSQNKIPWQLVTYPECSCLSGGLSNLSSWIWIGLIATNIISSRDPHFCCRPHWGLTSIIIISQPWPPLINCPQTTPNYCKVANYRPANRPKKLLVNNERFTFRATTFGNFREILIQI